MDVLKQLGIPVDEIELGFKLTVQTLVVVFGIPANLYTIFCVWRRSKLPPSTNIFMISLSLLLIIQSMNASIDYMYHLSQEEDYIWGFEACDVWHTLNVYLPMALCIHCFFCLLDRFIALSHPELLSKVMNPVTVMMMLLLSYIVPILITVPPIYFEWYTTPEYLKWRTTKECKFKMNKYYAIYSPIFTYWIPLGLVAYVIYRIFLTMAEHDHAIALGAVEGSSREKLQAMPDDQMIAKAPWKVAETRRQHRLAITLWSVYWNVSLFWIPQHAWQFIYTITDADWPRATNFMAWSGYLPSFIVPGLYVYYNVYEL